MLVKRHELSEGTTRFIRMPGLPIVVWDVPFSLGCGVSVTEGTDVSVALDTCSGPGFSSTIKVSPVFSPIWDKVLLSSLTSNGLGGNPHRTHTFSTLTSAILHRNSFNSPTVLSEVKSFSICWPFLLLTLNANAAISQFFWERTLRSYIEQILEDAAQESLYHK